MNAFKTIVPEKLKSAMGMMLSDAEGRKLAVNRLLPTLSYFISDLVVFVDNTTFDNTKFFDRIKSFVGNIRVSQDQVYF